MVSFFFFNVYSSFYFIFCSTAAMHRSFISPASGTQIKSEEDKLICMQRRYHHSHKAIFELREEPGDDI